jgi:hypothetical protein
MWEARRSVTVANGHELVRAYTEAFVRGEPGPADIVAKLELLDPAELTSLLPTLYGTGDIGAHRVALREAINAVLYRKTAASLVESIQTLDRSTQRLTWAGWAITIVVGIVGVVVPLLATLKCGR